MEIHRDVTLDRTRNRIVDAGGNFSWDYYSVSDEEDTEAGEVASLIGLANDIRSEVNLNLRKTIEKTVVMLVMFEILVEQTEYQAKKIDILDWRVLFVADSYWDEDDWESVWAEGRLDLDKEDGGVDMTNDNCDKYDNDSYDADCGNNTSCSVSIICFQDLIFLFSIRRRWSL